jgi:ribosomal protein S18 acetylase RimI-like enzyme
VPTAIRHALPVDIRRALPADIPAAARVTLDAYVGSGFIRPEDPYAAKLADAAHRADHAELWVAVGGGDVVGTVTFVRPGTPYAEVSAPDEGEFRMLAVSPHARGRGVGEALVRHCLTRATDLGLHAIVLSTLPQMRSAHRIYERMGFVRTPDRDWEPETGLLLITYRCRLGSTAGALP